MVGDQNRDKTDRTGIQRETTSRVKTELKVMHTVTQTERQTSK